MAYENVEFTQENFCIAPRTGEFCSIDHTQGTNGVLQIKTDTGSLQKTYSLDTSINKVYALEYTGPRDLSLSFSQLGDELPFFTLEHISDSNVRIRRWKLNNTSNSLVLDDTINLSNTGKYRFNSYTMAVEHYETEFDQATTTGTGRIKLTTYSGIESGDVLLLGPSSDTDNQYAFEYVEVTSVSGGWVYITSSGITPPKYEYAAGDAVTYWKNIYLFSDDGFNGNSSYGSYYKININTKTVTSGIQNGVFNNIRAASWSRDYQSVGFVNDTSVLYYDLNKNQVTKSQSLHNIEADEITIIPVYDLIFDNQIIYCLQRKITLVDDNGDKTTTSWSTYNYQRSTIAPYTKSISINTNPDGIVLNDEQVTLKVIVRDQFGVGLNNKTVYFYDSPDVGSFSSSGQVITNSNGEATITYDVNYFDPQGSDDDSIFITIKAKTDGASSFTGSQYVWAALDLILLKRFRIEFENLIQKRDEYELDTYITQLSGLDIDCYLRALNRFQFPGGNWEGTSPPSDDTVIIKQIEDFNSINYINQLDKDVIIDIYAEQLADKSNDFQLSQLYISRHKSSGHKDTAQIDQFRFVEDAIPVFWSEKNPVNTNIYIRLRPFAFSLNQSTLKFKVRELSYAGDTGFVDVTSLCNITTFDAGGGLLGLDILYNPSNDFHHNAIVYVSIEVYDTAPLPNIILTDYWFKIIPDYKSPYIINEYPSREAYDVPINSNIYFDLIDAGVGVDIDTLGFYINNVEVNYTVTTISGGYHVNYINTNEFSYGETVEVSVVVEDKSFNRNKLFDAWRFYCINSSGPWIDEESFYPEPCSKGVPRKIHGISANVYAVNGTGIDKDSILVRIGGKTRKVQIIPIIYRLK